MRIETFARRDRIRFSTVLNLVYGTSAERMREIITDLEKVLRDHPGTAKDETMTVRFMGFASSSLDLEVICYLTTTEMTQYRAWRQDLLFGFMEIVERKSGFAYPTQTVHVLQSRP
jgi:small-conductance mechanosensitive channel